MNQNNISLEKVIKGLECCISEKICNSPCPYRGQCDDGGYYYSKAIEDALALLKKQEPRLITKADFTDNPMIDDDGNLPAWVEFNHEKYGEFFEEDADGWGCVNINKVGKDMARYWTAKPSLKQMEATPWN